MHRAPFVDLAYIHETLAAPVQPDPAATAWRESQDLVARLACLKVLMDAEREPVPVDASQRYGVH